MPKDPDDAAPERVLLRLGKVDIVQYRFYQGVSGLFVPLLFMLRSKSYVKVTNKGSVVKVVKEHYLRDDIGCGVKGCMGCAEVMVPGRDVILVDPLGPQSVHSTFPPRILIPDTNIFLHHVHISYSSLYLSLWLSDGCD